LKTFLTDLTCRTQPAATQIMIRGVWRCQPEFSELQQVQTIIHLLKKSKTNLALFFKEPGEEKKQSDGQRFGLAQKTLEPIRTCTLISSTWRGSVPGQWSVGTNADGL